MSSEQLAGRIALVTGASRGIGESIARHLGLAGAEVVGTATSEAGAARVSEALAQRGIKGRGEIVDVSDSDSVGGLLQRLGEAGLAPSILVNNAGITRDNLLMRMKEEEWDAVLDANLSSLYRLCRGVLRGMMKARWGRIVNVGSVVGSLGNAGQANYAASKAGMVGFTKSLAREVASRNITVNAVAPGFIQTDMTEALPEAAREQLLTQVPLGRLGTPDDVAAGVMFLCSDAGGYVTGETLNINGGMFMP